MKKLNILRVSAGIGKDMNMILPPSFILHMHKHNIKRLLCKCQFHCFFEVYNVFKKSFFLLSFFLFLFLFNLLLDRTSALWYLYTWFSCKILPREFYRRRCQKWEISIFDINGLIKPCCIYKNVRTSLFLMFLHIWHF